MAFVRSVMMDNGTFIRISTIVKSSSEGHLEVAQMSTEFHLTKINEALKLKQLEKKNFRRLGNENMYAYDVFSGNSPRTSETWMQIQ